MFYKKILFQSSYLKIPHLIQCVTCHFSLSISVTDKQFLSEIVQSAYTIFKNSNDILHGPLFQM